MIEKLSGFIITKNEEEKIAGCLEHLAWVNELIVLDSYSTDKTIDVAKRFTKKIYKKKFEGYGEQKQEAINHCTNQWILEIDADEIVPKELEEEIKKLLNKKEKLERYAGYKIKRQEYFLGKPLMVSKILRLYRKDKVQYKGTIHETLNVQGGIGMLQNKIIHESDKYDTIAKRIEKNNEYTKREAERIYKRKTESIWTVLAKMIFIPITYFLWLYLEKGLIFKGYRGLIWSILTMHYHFLIYAKVYESIYTSREAPLS